MAKTKIVTVRNGYKVAYLLVTVSDYGVENSRPATKEEVKELTY